VPGIAPPTLLDLDESFSNFSPQFSAAWRMNTEKMVYGTVTRGFKAGGFNPISLPGFEAYDEEHAWHFEGGAKTTWADGLLHLNLAVFYIDWSDLQLNTPIPFTVGEFYITNAGDATSTGFELELGTMPVPGLELFTSFGYTNAEFGDGSVADGLPVDGNKLFNTPDYTVSGGVQYSRPVNTALNAFARFDVVGYGDFFYDNLNTEGQDAYALANIRAGVRASLFTVEFWMRNAFDTNYIPVALPFLSQSGFIAEPGAPRTFGISAGVRF
jgi:iron complex outermembrane recepter protein